MQQYADNTQTFNSFRLNEPIDAADKINDDFKSLISYARNHHFSINPNKYAHMIFGGKKLPH